MNSETYTIFDLGYSRWLTKNDGFYQSSVENLEQGVSTATSFTGGGLSSLGLNISGDSLIVDKPASSIINSFDSSGNVITELINEKLNTATKQILGDFTFGSSGAIKIVTNSDNGIWISPDGILAKKSGNTTFSLSTSGDATFAGTLSGASGTFGTITAGTISGVTISGATITGSTLTTGTSGKNVDITTGRISQRYNTTEYLFTDTSSTGGVFGIKNSDGNLICSLSLTTVLGGVHAILDVDYSSCDGLLINISGKEMVINVNQNSSIRPRVNNYGYFGNDSYAWKYIYSYNYVDKCHIYDKLDTISLLNKIKPKKDKNDELDHSTLPDFIKEGEESRNLGKFVDLLASAIKQLNQKVEILEKKIKQ